MSAKKTSDKQRKPHWGGNKQRSEKCLGSGEKVGTENGGKKATGATEKQKANEKRNEKNK